MSKRWKRKKTTAKDGDLTVTLGGPTDAIVVLMGPSGSGKSTFINCLLGEPVASVGHSLLPCTHSLKHIVRPLYSDPSRNLVLVDTPGFNNTDITEEDILRQIAVWLGASYKVDRKITGIIYLYEISQCRMIGATRRNIEMLRGLCGDDSLSSVVLATTKWASPEDVGLSRLQQLEKIYWSDFMRNGSNVFKLDNTRKSAIDIVDHLLRGKENITLQLAREIVDQHKSLPETTAGQKLLYTADRLYPNKKTIKSGDIMNEINQMVRDSRIPIEPTVTNTAASHAKPDQLRDNNKPVISLTIHDDLARKAVDKSPKRPVVSIREPTEADYGKGLTVPGKVSIPINVGLPALRSPILKPDRIDKVADFKEYTKLSPSDPLHDVHTTITQMLVKKAKLRLLSKYQNEKAQKLLDVLQMFLDHPSIPAVDKGYFRKVIILIAVRSEQFPSSVTVEAGDMSIPEHPAAYGQYGDIYKCTFRDRPVCLKVLKMYQNGEAGKIKKAFLQEVFLWNQLSHPNILPFYGAFLLRSKSDRPCFVSPWMEEGNITEYIRKKGAEVNRYNLISDIAEGIYYLHSINIVHGDIKGVNVLVNEFGRACLADFGLSNLPTPHLPSLTSMTTSGNQISGTIRWQAPELLKGESNVNTMACDIYSFASTCYEILTGLIPYSEFPLNPTVIFHVTVNQLTPTLSNVKADPAFCSILRDCWNMDPGKRPTIKQVIERLEPHLPLDRRPGAADNISETESYLSPTWFRRHLRTQAEMTLIRDVANFLKEAKAPVEPDVET